MTMSPLRALYERHGQSVWLDDFRREWLHDGQLERWIERGVRGLTTNPAIVRDAVSSSASYDEEFGALLAAGHSIEEALWQLLIVDVAGALDIFRPVYESSGGLDGSVSIEVDPRLAHSAEGTLAAARSLWSAIDRPNLLVKIPATPAGVSAVRSAVAERINVNVTLLFSVDRYREVMEAYIAGLENTPGDLSTIASVASFFVSRVDVQVDAQLDALAATLLDGGGSGVASERVHELKGRAAVANAQLAYQAFQETFSGPRWDALAARGARPQRPLWASTSTKGGGSPDTKYVDALIGPHSVTTVPAATLDSFIDHGTVARTVDAEPASAVAVLAELRSVGIDLATVAEYLERDGVDRFRSSFESTLSALTERSGDQASRR